MKIKNNSSGSIRVIDDQAPPKNEYDDKSVNLPKKDELEKQIDVEDVYQFNYPHEGK